MLMQKITRRWKGFTADLGGKFKPRTRVVSYLSWGAPSQVTTKRVSSSSSNTCNVIHGGNLQCREDKQDTGYIRNACTIENGRITDMGRGQRGGKFPTPRGNRGTYVDSDSDLQRVCENPGQLLLHIHKRKVTREPYMNSRAYRQTRRVVSGVDMMFGISGIAWNICNVQGLCC